MKKNSTSIDNGKKLLQFDNEITIAKYSIDINLNISIFQLKIFQFINSKNKEIHLINERNIFDGF